LSRCPSANHFTCETLSSTSCSALWISHDPRCKWVFAAGHHAAYPGISQIEHGAFEVDSKQMPVQDWSSRSTPLHHNWATAITLYPQFRCPLWLESCHFHPYLKQGASSMTSYDTIYSHEGHRRNKS